MVTSKDVQQIVSLLSSDKAKCREEGVKLLSTWLDGERAINFCHYLGRETERIKPTEIPHSESWPFLVSLLVQCVTSEVSSSKRRSPKISFAKSLRTAIQRAEDTKFSGRSLPLLPIVRTLFGHVWDILSNVSGFQTEYAVILRVLLSSRDYRFHIRSRVYNNLAIFYFEKIQNIFPLGISNQKEELFRCILTLHSILENPPGDFNDECRGICVEGFVNIFSSLREESKISRKLIECVNTFLLKDGPNLGTKYIEIHVAMWHFTFHVWNSTHDRGLKEILYTYANIQLNLVRGTSQDDCLVDQILDLVCKDLDLASTSGTGYLWGDALKDDKVGSNRVLNCKLAELAARTFYRTCSRAMQHYSTEKRIKREPMNVVIREALAGGKWTWHLAFIFLVRKYFNRVSEEMFFYWFDGISCSLERAMINTNYDVLLWTLRSLLELSIAFNFHMDKSSFSFSRNSKFCSSWQLVWSCLINGLPLYSNLQALGDVAMVLLGNIVRCDQTTPCAVPSDFWDLKLFQEPLSVPVLYFIACYFSHKASQVDFQDSFRLRKHLLNSTFRILRKKEWRAVKGHMVHIFPATVFSLATSSLVHNNYESFLRSISLADPTDLEIWTDEEKECDPFDCSVKSLVRIDLEGHSKGSPSPSFESSRFPQDLRDMLLNEMVCGILGAMEDDDRENVSISDTISICALLLNILSGITALRKNENIKVDFSKLGNHLVQVLDIALNGMKNNDNSTRFLASLDSDDEFRVLLLTSLRSFVGCPLLSDKNQLFFVEKSFYGDLVKCVKRMLGIFVGHYECYTTDMESSLAKSLTPDFPTSSDSSQNFTNSANSTKMIVDLDLDVDADVQNLISIGGKQRVGLVAATTDRKIFIISLISSLSSILSSAVWDSLFELMHKECDDKVSQIILHCLCQLCHCSSIVKIESMVAFVGDLILVRQVNKLDCRCIVTAINQLLCSINSLKSVTGYNVMKYDQSLSEKRDYDEVLKSITQKLTSIAEAGLLDWMGRCMLVEAISNMVVFSPTNAQSMISNLLLLLQDCDFRVRIKLARRIGVLFQTWDGHKTLFEDICASLGLAIVVPFKAKRVTFNEVLAAGPQPYSMLETAVILLMHLSYFSEKIELEAIFMMCAISALNACVRELVDAALDELSTRLSYSTRFKYLEHLLGSILFYCVACGINISTLMEIRQHFISELEPSYFVQYCCQWLLPALLLYNDNNNLKLVSQITSQSLEVICRDHFVSICAVCICLICSTDEDKKAGGADVLKNSFLQIASLSDVERDKLIKKHMVSIVSRIFSLTSCAPDSSLPLFSIKTIALATHKIVDGFLEINDLPSTGEIVDRINIFRPDRVFMFILEIHYQIEAASNVRHKRDKLAGLEVLVDILGGRASSLSTTTYVLNLAGQWITSETLGEQCCRLISNLLDHVNISDANTLSVLGDQLQFLVPKLVANVTVAEAVKETGSPQMVLLSRLIMDSPHGLNAYIRELEPFPKISIFDELRNFHDDLCEEYSPKQHLLNIVTRSSYLPPKLLFWSIRALHRKWPFLENVSTYSSKKLSWKNASLHDPESLAAVWNLVYLCQSFEADNIKPLVCDFVCKAEINDLNSIVVHLRGNPHYINVNNANNSEIYLDLSSGMSEELLASLLELLGKYLIDNSAKIVHTSSQVLRGLLSTDKGQRALLKLNLLQRSIVKIHSNGVNAGLIEHLLSDLEERFRAESIPLESSDLWQTNGKNFDSWVCTIVYSLIGSSKDVILRLCHDVAMLKAELAELLLPGVIVNIARINDANVNLHQLLSSQMESYIFTENNKLHKSIQVFLDALNELRICHILQSSSITQQKLPSSKHGKSSTHVTKSPATSLKARDSSATSNSILISSSWIKVYWVAVDYLVVAKSAVMCGMYFTAMMYVEHWCEDNFGELTLGESDFSHMEVVPKHIEILLSAVTQINEPDSLYGIIRSHTLSSQAIIYEHEGSWNKALEYYDLQIRTGGNTQKPSSSEILLAKNTETCSSYPYLSSDVTSKPYKGLIRSLQQIGCTHVLDLYCHGLTSAAGKICQDVEFSELQYEAAWRSGKWDFSTMMKESDITLCDDVGKYKNFNHNLHKCLKALHNRESNDFQKILQLSKQELLRSIAWASVESTEYIFSTIVKLKIFHHLGVAWNFLWPSTVDGGGKQNSILDDGDSIGENTAWLKADWNSSLNHLQTNMGLLDLMIAFRRVVLHLSGSSKLAIQHLLLSSSLLRKGSRFSQAASILHELKYLSTKNGEPFPNSYWFGRLEEAKLLRAQDHHDTAIKLAEYVCQNCQSDEVSLDAHRLIGKWLAETRSSSSKTILEKHLKPALSLAEEQLSSERKGVKGLIKCHFYLAHYTDALFRSYEERLNSSEWKTSLNLRKLKKIELEELIRRFKSSRKEEKDEYSPKIHELQKQLIIEQDEEKRLQDDRDSFLRLALDGYKRTLLTGDNYDVLVVFRLVSLWFSFSSTEDVLQNMSSTITEVPSFKFLDLVYQIASRMGSSNDAIGSSEFQQLLVSLLKKMSLDHPYHTIFQILALANGDRIKEKQRNRNSFVVDKEKMITAKGLLQELSSSKPAVIKQMKQAVEIYIKLAELETKREDVGKKALLPRDIRGVKHLELVPVVTATIPVDRDCQYLDGSFPYFQGLSDSVIIMNGINAPKVLECMGSDGKKYRQLAKSGNDDLRQDAVMEQFFGLVNAFLQKNRDTRQRSLSVRTYKVVPLTPSAGVLEWVNGTLPLGDYLLGSSRNGGAHVRYRHDDWLFAKCRDHMSNEKDKRKAYQTVCKNFRPVLHHFFLERFLQPADWFQKRLAYTRSVASSSMVGYIVGLGDRHSMNILIDQASAEVVHIDLGVAFEQGLMLKTPERVPFRLTRDVIDGMGVTGVEGVFRRCCEETLSVMRTNKEALLTIVEVFIHDPLYKWALSPLKALQRQKDMDDDVEANLEGVSDGYEGNKDATRALIRVKQKLEGYEEGELRSVQGQVQQLIQDAVDPERLCLMFPGWAPWL